MTTLTLRRALLSASFAALLGLPAGLRAQAPASTPTPTPAPAATPSFTPEEVGINEKLGATIPLDLELKAEDGKPVTLRQLIDKPTILTLNYFRCAGICTPQLSGVAEVLNRTKAEPGKDFQVITVSFDERDEPEVASQKRINYLGEITRPFPPAAWRFLTGPGATTKALADAVGFKFKRVNDDFVHAAAIIFISPKGQITRYMYGVTYLPADLQLAAQEAARGEAQPTINKFLKFCFSYDPAGRKYVLNTTSLGATFIILAALVFVFFLVRRGRQTKSEEGQ
ncbi:cytochrome-c oxidase [Geothrix limicola]|uniref:Cytochrome-c oxidase n=1 Tax=Geothrix limicola TaxID=2927978 RepID=A0ABQ5QFT0_9BACT|nr:SCO family protein [Geothrix limicola]GLH73025.1 cytochrome-c oxidase [Geothrix limicola]